MFVERRANSLVTRRIKQPWPKDKIFKILSLDGGGIKGIYTAKILATAESELRGNGLVSDYFDMIAGTSTGGIIALGLGLRMPISDIVSFYENDGREIFPPLPASSLGKVKRFLVSAARTKLRHDKLESALKKRFQNHLLGDSFSRLVIPAFMMPKTEIAVFKTDHHEDFGNDHLTPMWQVARSTSAAPTYLKGLEHKDSGKIFIDGGVWANNPVMVAIIDALSAYDVHVDQIRVLSIGTGNAPFKLSKPIIELGWVGWLQAVKAAMFLTTDNATAQAKLLLGPENCLRIEPDENGGYIEMDDYDNAFSIFPAMADQHYQDNRDLIRTFFEEKASPRERHYTDNP